jgi:predicted phage-related endonuclease
MTNPNDFDQDFRKTAWWSGDTRLAARGKANDAILTKLGLLDPPDLSQVEAVQMGHVMEPVIGRLAQAKLGVELTKIDEWVAHPKESWLRSHFDFTGTRNGKQILVECKNYNMAVRGKFDASGIAPAADVAQVIHEAAVLGVEEVYLAVLFGGQEFVLIPFQITEEQKTTLVQEMARYWACVQSQTPLPPETPEQARLLYPTSSDTIKTATGQVEEACRVLKLIKQEISALEERKEHLESAVQGYMENNSTLSTIDGNILATWKSAKPSKRFDAKLFQASMPDIYEKFVVEQMGSRRFLVK